MRSEDDGTLFVALRDLLDNGPHEATSLRIHACGRLVKKDDRRVTDNGDGDGQLSLVTT